MGALDTVSASKELVAQVRSDQFVEQLALALPETVSPRRFARIAVTAIQQNPDLGLCSRESVSQALLRCAADGLLPDGREAAIVKRGKTDPKAVYMPMVDGYKKVAADHGWMIRARVVCENDTFAYSEQPQSLVHTPTRPGLEPGPMVCAYAVATHQDGRRLQVVMDASEIEKRRAMATTDQVWSKWPAAMWEKTCIRDIFKDLPLGDLDQERIRSMLAADRAFEDAGTEPVEALYGPPGIPSGEAAAASTGGGADGGDGTGRVARDTASSAPVAAVDIEEGEWEEASVDDSGPATGLSEETIEAAAQVSVPGGVHQGKTLEQVAAEDDGEKWFAAQLKRLAPDDRMRPAIETFAQGRLPELWQTYETWRSTQ